MRRMVLSLSAIYIVMTVLLLAMTPWRELGVGESPFVRVLARLGIPGAAGVMNFVVLTAALSSANANTLRHCADAVFARRAAATRRKPSDA